MPKQRDRVRMTEDEVAAMLAAGRKVQLATIGPDGYPHLVTMYYTLIDGKIAFWTYRTSQKALNLSRDPRISCLVETGEAYFDLRGVQIQGIAETITDPGAVYQIGLGIGAAMAADGSAARGSANSGAAGLEGVSDYVANAARKRYAYLVSPVRVISWDHTKLIGQ
jgi:Pyridoxamine 5'-phosphate oxidase